MNQPPRIEEVAVGRRLFEEPDDRAFQKGGYGRTPQLGRRPVLIIVDATYEFCGQDRTDSHLPDPLYPKGSGSRAWDAIKHLQHLIPAARRAGVPVIYSRNEQRVHPIEVGGWGRKTSPQSEPEDLEIVAEIGPTSDDLVIRKTKPSAFFATPLSSWLTEIGADTVLVCGGTTSGCVRATVTDAFSHNLNTFVVLDAVFDRSEVSHQVNLYEMQQKYAGLIEAERLVAWFEAIAGSDQ